MMRAFQIKHKHLLISILFIGILNYTKAEVKDSTVVLQEKRTFIYPNGNQPFKFNSTISVILTKLPLDWIETAKTEPIVLLATQYSLPVHFSIDAGVQSNFKSNLVRMGSKYHYSYGAFSASAGIDAAFQYHYAKAYESVNKVWGWASYPNLSIGYTTADLSFTLISELNYIYSQNIKYEEVKILHSENILAGYSVGLYVEQKLFKEQVLTLGLINNFQKQFFTSVSTFNRYYYIPQIYFGLVL
jgi:hypothetical protein